jgi:hypothetical protein
LVAKALLELQLTTLYSPRADPAEAIRVGAGAAARDSVSAVETTLSAAAVVEPVSAAKTREEESGAIMMTAIIPREKDLISKKGIRDKYTWASYHLGKLCQKKACIKAYFEYTICTFVF